ncbi:hypothetical protein ACFY3N_36410 [Streptomyces sp. NPDC000348]|uniref:hypothetical protein n=1 Tax=Streptomyces sp. NPDC000348 TaxID=3364538 RepID=UPI0036A59AA4
MPGARKNETVSHELTVLAFDPEHSPYDDATVKALRYLEPVNVIEQFTAMDEHARELAGLCAEAVVDGLLMPETGDAPERTRADWQRYIHHTLDHHRDPHHGHLSCPEFHRVRS